MVCSVRHTYARFLASVQFQFVLTGRGDISRLSPEDVAPKPSAFCTVSTSPQNKTPAALEAVKNSIHIRTVEFSVGRPSSIRIIHPGSLSAIHPQSSDVVLILHLAGTTSRLKSFPMTHHFRVWAIVIIIWHRNTNIPGVRLNEKGRGLLGQTRR